MINKAFFIYFIRSSFHYAGNVLFTLEEAFESKWKTSENEIRIPAAFFLILCRNQ